MRRNLLETVTGGVVLAVAVLFLVFAYGKADLESVDGYEIAAKFDRADGIRPGTDVRMSGIKVGAVTSSSLDPETYLAIVGMTIRADVKVPEDTAAAILSDGLLGDRYLSLSPGGSDEMLPPGGEIRATQGAVDLMALIGRAIFSQAEGKDDDLD